jgi:protein-S-isoprenylcysteine O-methyltransferase Ste14
MMNENIETKLKLLTTTMLLGSAVYEFMYFQGVGISISQAPLSVIDFIRGWAEWAMFAFGILFGVFVNELLFGRVEKWRSENEIISSSENPSKLTFFRELPFTLIKHFSYILAFAFLLIGEAVIVATSMGIIVLAIIFFKWLMEGSPYEEKFLNKSTILLVVLIVGVSINGFHKGVMALNYPYKNIEAEMKIDDGVVKVIRIFDQWALVKTKEESFGWVNNQSNKLIKIHTDRYQFIGLLCYAKKNYEFAKDLPITSCRYTYEIINY